MGTFSDKTRSAAKFVVTQLPSVTIDGAKFYIREFKHRMLFDSRSLAGELTMLEGTTKIAETKLTIDSLNICIGQLLVDVDGANMLQDREDVAAWLDFIQDQPDLQKELFAKSGITAWIESRTTTTTTEPSEPIDLQEVALGNSEPSLGTE